MASQATKMAREKPVKSAVLVNPTESDIATVAYQLWLDSGCPIGSDQEMWFRAEAMLKEALAAQCEDPSSRPSTPSRVTRTATVTTIEFTTERWDGHWETWEREWGGARWVWDGSAQC